MCGGKLIPKSLWFVACLASIALPCYASELNYPTKPVRMVVGAAPGGGTDLVARPVAQKLTGAWGQQVVVDNRPGAAGTIGTETVARAQPDGYTILMGSITTNAVNQALYKKLNYDPIKDFVPVSLVISAPQLLAVHHSVPVRTIRELIVLAKAKPGQLNYASAGSGSSPQLTFELFKRAAGIDIIHIPYKGTGPAIIDLVAGHVQMMITGIVAPMPHVKAGRLRGIAVTSAKRAAALPDLPTFAESGVPDFDVSTWFGAFFPAGTPRSIVAKLNGEIRRILEMPDIRQYFLDQGAYPAANTPEQFAAFVKSEVERWGRVVRETGVKVD